MRLLSRPILRNIFLVGSRRSIYQVSTNRAFIRLASSPSTNVTDAQSTGEVDATRAQLLADANRKVHFRATVIPHPLYEKPQRLQVAPEDIEWDNPMHHEIWTKEEVNGVQVQHTPPVDFVDKFAYTGTLALRFGFDLFSGYLFGPITTEKLLRRIVFLETTAGIPGMVAGAIRHLRSLRIMRRDHGWIHTLLEEAENERMHLLVFKDMKNPGLILKTFVLFAQGIFWNVFFSMYLISPRLCHRFVGYIEEEAVRTYTKAIEAYDKGLLPELKTMPVPSIARSYWRLGADCTMRDVLLAVRADEANHRDTNHTFGSLQADDYNPYVLQKR